MSGPRGDQLENCLAPLPKGFLFLQPTSLLSLPSFSPLSCPNLAQFPVQLKQHAYELVSGLVEDETGQTRLLLNGFNYEDGCCDHSTAGDGGSGVTAIGRKQQTQA